MLDVQGYDLILGIDWLSSFGQMTVDWSKGMRKLKHKGKQVILQVQDVTAELKVCQVLNCNFASRVVIHTPRSCDLVAHELAIVGAGLSPGLISVRDCIPSCIQVLVC